MVVSFEIPDLGITFKAPFEGHSDHTDLASLLALLEFVDLNRKLFGNKTLQIYGNNLRVVQQINEVAPLEEELEPLITKALMYRNKYRFSLEWTPADRNPALNNSL